MDSLAARLLAGLVAVVFFGAVVVLFWYTTLRPPTHPDRVTLEELPADVHIAWTGDAAVISTDDRRSALTAIGYVHGSTQPWLAELRRRTALGTLSEWFGGGLLPIDRHVRQLGLAAQAQEAYDDLSPPAQDALQAYTDGLNRALLSSRGRATDAFVSLDVAPGRWEAWHPLAVEQLVAWLSTPPGRWYRSASDRPVALQTFVERDRLLRRWLHVHGLERSTAWVATDTTRGRPLPPTLFQRHTTGASALPFYNEIVWNRGDQQSTFASVAGTLLFPAGTTSNGSAGTGTVRSRSWAILLGSDGTLRRLPVDTTQIRSRLERLTLRGGAETLAPVRRSAEGLPFVAPPDTSLLARLDTTAIDSLLLRDIRTAAAPHRVLRQALRSDSLTADSLLHPPSPTDSTWVLQWSGLRTETDVQAWLQLAGLAERPSSPDSLSFSLFDGVGLHVDGNDWSTSGRPPVQIPVPGGVMIGRTPWTGLQARALDERLGDTPMPRPGRWSASDSSSWAAALLPQMVEAIAPLGEGPPVLRDATTYLRNWNGVYDGASIGATVFDRSIRAYRTEIGRLPSSDRPAYFAAYRQRRAFVEAVDSLLREQGRDLRRWRWERVVPDRRSFPAFSADSLLDQDVHSLSETRYAPVERPGRGHPSTLADGPTLIVDRPLGPAPSTWEAWTDSAGTGLTVRRLHVDPSAFLARPLLDEDRPDPVHLRSLTSNASTRLVPASSP